MLHEPERGQRFQRYMSLTGLGNPWSVIVTRQTKPLCTVDQIRAFLNGNETVDDLPQDRAGVYEFRPPYAGSHRL